MHQAQKRNFSLFITLATALCVVELWIATSSYFPQNSSVLTFGITLDLLLGLPLLFYGLVVRPFRLPSITLAPIFLLAIVIASYILPPSGHTYLDRAKLFVPLIEITLLSVVIWKARGIYQHYRQIRRQETYFEDAVATSVRSAFGSSPAVTLLTTEMSLIFLALFGWFLKFRPINPKYMVFTYHRKNLYHAIFLVLLVLIALETLTLHVLIQRIVAWQCTTLAPLAVNGHSFNLHNFPKSSI